VPQVRGSAADMDSVVSRAQAVCAQLAEFDIPIRVQVEHNANVVTLEVELSPIATLCLLEMLSSQLREFVPIDPLPNPTTKH